MYRKTLLILLIIFAVCGCAQYTYFGSIEEQDSDGNMRTNLVYWTKTERKLWFDESSGSIKLLTECSLSTVNFDEKENGIIFYNTGGNEGVSHPVNINEPCGEILDVKKINKLTEGTLRLKIYCKNVDEEFTEGNHAYLKAKDGVYEFQIIRGKSTEFEDGVPKRPDCRETNNTTSINIK